MVAGNSINESTTGISGFTGTAFVGTPVTNHAVIIGGSTSSTLTNVGPTATAGQVLQSAGSSADPSFSTPTYPSASGSSGVIIRSDGTNNIYSAFTMANPGTSGNVLTSDGTNWLSSAAGGGGILTATWSITSAQIKALHGTPIQIIAAPGAGKIICVISVLYGKYTYGGTNAFTAGSAQTLSIYYGTATKVCDLISNGFLTGTSSGYSTLVQSSGTAIAAASIENLAVNVYNPVVTEITGNAGNNNTSSGIVAYYIATL